MVARKRLVAFPVKAAELPTKTLFNRWLRDDEAARGKFALHEHESVPVATLLTRELYEDYAKWLTDVYLPESGNPLSSQTSESYFGILVSDMERTAARKARGAQKNAVTKFFMCNKGTLYRLLEQVQWYRGLKSNMRLLSEARLANHRLRPQKEKVPPPRCVHGKANNGYRCMLCPGKGICEHRRKRHKGKKSDCKECACECGSRPRNAPLGCGRCRGWARASYPHGYWDEPWLIPWKEAAKKIENDGSGKKRKEKRKQSLAFPRTALFNDCCGLKGFVPAFLGFSGVSDQEACRPARPRVRVTSAEQLSLPGRGEVTDGCEIAPRFL